MLNFFPSRYPGYCVECGVRFQPASLHCFKNERGEFKVVCEDCRPGFAAKYGATHAPAIHLEVRESLFSRTQSAVNGIERPIVVSTRNLPQALFDEFLPVVKGSLWVPEYRVNVVHPGALRDLVQALLAHPDLKPHVTIAPEVKAILREQDEAYNRSLAEVAERVEAGLRLYPFQVVGAAWLKSRKRALLADDMGLGKTIQALTAIPERAPLLIVCPAVAKGVWKREIARWRKDYRIVNTLSGRGSFRWPGEGRVVITNYDILSDEVSEATPGTVVIFDEAHVLKGYKTARHARAKEIARAPGVERVYGLTATPLQNRPQELWSLMEVLDVATEAYGTFGQFCYAFNGNPSSGWGVPRPSAALGFQRTCLRRTKTEVLKDLPVKQRSFTNVSVKLSVSDRMIVDEAEEALFKYGAQVPFELIAKARAITAKAKGPAAVERVEEFEDAGTPLVVFSYHRAVVDEIGSRPGWRLITGDTPNHVRTEIEDAFQAGHLRGVAGTMQAMGVAITLTRASNVLFVDRGWNPSINEQAEDRCNRIGQTRGVQIEVLVAEGTIDERVEEIIEEKALIIAESVDKAANVEQRQEIAGLSEVEEEIRSNPLPRSETVRKVAEDAATIYVEPTWNDEIPF